MSHFTSTGYVQNSFWIIEQYYLNSWHTFASIFIVWWQLSSSCNSGCIFIWLLIILWHSFETQFRKICQDKIVEYENKNKKSPFIYLPLDNQPSSHKQVVFDIYAFWIHKFCVPQQQFTFFILLRFDLHTHKQLF